MSASKGPSSCKEKGCRRKLRNEKEMGPCRLKLLEVFRGKKKTQGRKKPSELFFLRVARKSGVPWKNGNSLEVGCLSG
jgi:hypothetical protein